MNLKCNLNVKLISFQCMQPIKNPDKKSLFGNGQTSILIARQLELILEEKQLKMSKSFYDLKP